MKGTARFHRSEVQILYWLMIIENIWWVKMATYNSNTIGDALISLLNSGINYGSSDVVSSLWDSYAGEEVRGYFKFDRATILSIVGSGTITSVVLYVYAENNGAYGDAYKIKRCGDFTESTITWATRPTNYEDSDASFPTISYSWQTNDITTLWNAQTSGSVFALNIECYTDGGFVRCHSKENVSGNKAYLLITASATCTIPGCGFNIT